MVRFWAMLAGDLARFRRRLALRLPQPGLYAYALTTATARRRIHLRIEPGGGTLFLNAVETVQLNATAAQMTWWALEGVPEAAVAAWFRGRLGGKCKDWRRQLREVYAWAARLADADACPTCGVPSASLTDALPVAAAPYKADLALTYACNNDCPHCYNESGRLRGRGLSPDQWREAIDRLTEVGVPHLIFTGGEPTLHPHLAELVAHAHRRQAVCGLNTNGRRLADRRLVAALAAAGLDHVQITLGSHRPEVHERMTAAASFRETVAGIENALACSLHTITNTTLMRMNAAEMEDTVEFLHRLGVRTFAVNGMICSGGGAASGTQALAEEELAPLLARIRNRAAELGMRLLWYTPTQYCRFSPAELDLGEKRCNAAEYSVCIEPNGDVLPCQSYYASAGNLLRDPWETIWNAPLFRRIRHRTVDLPPQMPAGCRDCPDLPACGGGCPLLWTAAGPNADGATADAADESKSSPCEKALARRRATGRFAAEEKTLPAASGLPLLHTWD